MIRIPFGAVCGFSATEKYFCVAYEALKIHMQCMHTKIFTLYYT